MRWACSSASHPCSGLHTVLGLIFAFALNLNRVAVLLGVYSNLPWILVPYYTLATWLGAAMLRTELPPGVVERLDGGAGEPLLDRVPRRRSR